MNFFTFKLFIILILLSNPKCFANNTEYSTKISNPSFPSITTKTADNPIFKSKTPNSKFPKKNEALTISILEFIRKHTDPYRKKNEAQGSWIKSTKWIKNPNWIKKELV
ncbi:hypothetical protein [Aquimarina sediminis]|uniref:hypothetical protein n=1 Tax=Aquimarina sediminis TaxID=2070536 RepID=UPI000CA08304|nr:hypothetical protein [Aquimarina sediminis]